MDTLFVCFSPYLRVSFAPTASLPFAFYATASRQRLRSLSGECRGGGPDAVAFRLQRGPDRDASHREHCASSPPSTAYKLSVYASRTNSRTPMQDSLPPVDLGLGRSKRSLAGGNSKLRCTASFRFDQACPDALWTARETAVTRGRRLPMGTECCRPFSEFVRGRDSPGRPLRVSVSVGTVQR